MKQYFVYILTNHSRKLIYVGMTDDIVRRYHEHKNRQFIGFTSSYNIDRLVYYEVLPNLEKALAREQQIKKWRREKKDRLVESRNPNWDILLPQAIKSRNIIAEIKYSAPLEKDPSASLGIK